MAFLIICKDASNVKQKLVDSPKNNPASVAKGNAASITAQFI
jgi:hypothetical protein